MKTYLCKITLYGSKPPYWWRCHIPAGISFSALSILLDRLIGEETAEPFSFEVRQYARIWEPSTADPLYSTFFCSAYDAAHTAVDILLDTGKPVNYLQNGKTYQIRVESVNESYPLSYPLVLKSPRGTDVNMYIKKMQDGFRIEDRVMQRPKNREKMLLQARNGVLRIPRVQRTLGESAPYYMESSSLMLQKLGEELRSLMGDVVLPREATSDEETEDQYTFLEILDFYHRDELEDIAKTHGIPLQKKESKSEVIGRIEKALMDSDMFYRHFVSLTDAETAAFEEIMNAGGFLKISPEQEKHFSALIKASYAFYDTEDYILLGTDVMNAYRKISTPEFHILRKKVSYLRQILDIIVPDFYAMIPLRKFCRICRRVNDPQLSADEVPDLLSLIPDSMHFCVVRDDAVYTSQLIRDPDALTWIRSVHGDKPYYIIKEDEIDEILQYGYPRSKRAYRQFREYLLTEMKTPPDVVEEVLGKMHSMIARTYKIQEIFDMLNKHGIIPTKKQADELVKLYQDLVSNTRTMYNRGYTPAEMARIAPDEAYRNIRIDDAKIAVRD